MAHVGSRFASVERVLLRLKMFLYKALALGTYLTYAAASAVLPLRGTTLRPRDAPVNGSCVSGPDTSCVSLVSLCVASIASGEVGSAAFWSSNVCAAAATCAGESCIHINNDAR
ncbi:hypothetical protein GY45DRAFT_1077241 [Cubamyces sp. BRFM 1775]|nr:hypothetical protein GY45DRAFT_1077241 [Cubamyces sp. BRFM 1775]